MIRVRLASERGRKEASRWYSGGVIRLLAIPLIE
jgi:hypothetical protein